MKPVDQTLFGEGRGNCLQACIASVLELPLEAVPHFVLKDDWVEALQMFLARFDLWTIPMDASSSWDKRFVPRGYHLISGPSPRDNSIWHSIVGYQGKMVHDPHPSRAGLEKEETWDLFVSTLLNLGGNGADQT